MSEVYIVKLIEECYKASTNLFETREYRIMKLYNLRPSAYIIKNAN
jgi:hypothetical protein